MQFNEDKTIRRVMKRIGELMDDRRGFIRKIAGGGVGIFAGMSLLSKPLFAQCGSMYLQEFCGRETGHPICTWGGGCNSTASCCDGEDWCPSGGSPISGAYCFGDCDDSLVIICGYPVCRCEYEVSECDFC
jgi:hypothetical protein